MRQKDDKYGLPERFLLKAFPLTEIREHCNALRQQPGNVWLSIISSRRKQSFQPVMRQKDDHKSDPQPKEVPCLWATWMPPGCFRDWELCESCVLPRGIVRTHLPLHGKVRGHMEDVSSASSYLSFITSIGERKSVVL